MANTLWQQALWAGDGAIVLKFGQLIDPDVNRLVHRVGTAVRSADIPGVWGIVPAYTTLLVEYDPVATSGERVLSIIEKLPVEEDNRLPRTFVVPVLYGGEGGADLLYAANTLGLAPEQVIRQHTASPYLIYCLGFSPGFPLCGTLASELQLPRRSSPRTVVPAGSVAIAGAQTGVYPTETPGGWHLLGRTPVQLFDIQRDPPILYQPGDYLWFRAVDDDEFIHLKDLVLTGHEVVKEVPYAAN